jgi:hypothetical protein
VLSYFMYEQALSEYGVAHGLWRCHRGRYCSLIMLVFISLFIVRMLAAGKERLNVPHPHREKASHHGRSDGLQDGCCPPRSSSGYCR